MLSERVKRLGDPNELVAKIIGAVDTPSDEYTMLRVQSDGSIVEYPLRLRLLSLAENQVVMLEAQKRAQEKGELKGYDDIYREEQAVQTIFRALRKRELTTNKDGTSFYLPLFVDADQLRESFTANEIAQCVNAYELLKQKFGALEDFTEEEIAYWIEHLSKGAEGYNFLARLPLDDWPRLMISLAAMALPALSSLQRTSESDQETSTSTTGTLSKLPSMSASDGTELPTDRNLTQAEAREMVRKKKARRKK